ncbi:MAG: DUF4251 domain-containing protein [Candidatus Egerieousia sp.]
MKKIFAILLVCFAVLSVSGQAYSQTKRETRKERKARIEKMISDKASSKKFRIDVTRVCPKNGVAQNVVYSKDANYIEFNKDRITCNLPYIGGSERTQTAAYSSNSNNNLNIFAEHQICTIFGGWQEKDGCYRFSTVFWNDNNSSKPGAMQVTLIVQFDKEGSALMMVQINGMESMSYMGELSEEEVNDAPGVYAK